MTQTETNTRPRPSRQHRVYGWMTIVCSLAVTFLFHELGGQKVAAGAISVFGVALVLSRWQFFAIMIPLALFYGVTFGDMDLGSSRMIQVTTQGGVTFAGELVSDDGNQIVIRNATGLQYRIAAAEIAQRQVSFVSMMPKSLPIFLGVVLLASSYRFCACLPTDKASGSLTSRMTYTPVVASRVGKASLHWADFSSFGLIAAAMALSLMLCSPLDQTLKSVPHIGLIPEGYFAIKMVLLMAILVAVSRGTLSYLAISLGDGSLASLQLRRELWKSDGAEQRRVARQMKRDS